MSKRRSLGWTAKENEAGNSLNLKEEWLEKEYKGHRLNQVVLSTHSKTLIYKIFTMGKNFIVTNEVKEINYEDAENELREIGLSTIHSKVLLVEGTGDHDSLEYILRGESINIKPLGGSKEVVETFKKIASLRSHIREMKFVFLVDSDNKPQEYFDKIRALDEDFYDKSFIRLSKHEFENYLLDEYVFETVIDKYFEISGEEVRNVTAEDIKVKFKELAIISLPQVYKKETSLALNHKVESFFSQKLWGNSAFSWNSKANVLDQIDNQVLDDASVQSLAEELRTAVATVFELYEEEDEDILLNRCDGKQVFGKASAYYAKYTGVDNKVFKKAIYQKAVRMDGSQLSILVKHILRSFS